MQSDYPHQVMHQRRIQAMAIDAQRQSNGTVVTVAYAFMIAIAALWVVQLPSVTGSILSQLNMIPNSPASFNPTVNRENKGDRLSVVTFDERWNALGKPDTLHPTATIPAPCGVGVPCGGGVSPRTKIALAK